jgi:hypothetical protein
LFAGTAFADQAEQGPWLLPNPTPEFIAAHPQLGGVYVTSDAAIDVVQQHWQSLIEVAFAYSHAWRSLNNIHADHVIPSMPIAQ